MANQTFKGTPGPWSIAGKHSVYTGMGTITQSENRNSRDVEHNMKLVAAAPELLDACLEFVRKVECGEARSTKSYQQMKSAISKALD